MPHRTAPVGGNFGRLWPYVWRQRRALIPSFGFAALVAVFWGLNLALTFPVVKVWLQGESLDGYVAAEIERAEGLRADYVAHLGRIDDRLKGGPLHGAGGEVVSTEPPDEDEQIALIADQARAERKLEAAGWDLYLMEWVQTHVLPHLPADQFDLLATIFGTLLVMTMAKGLCVFTQDVLVGGAIERVMVQLRTHAFRKTLALDQQTLAREGTANLMARFTNDVNQLAYGLQLIGGKVVREPLKALACLTGAMLVSWRLTLLSLVFAPLAALIFYKIGKAMKRASARLMDSTAAIYTTLEETFDASKVVIAYGGGPRHRRQFHQRNKDYLKTATRIVRFDAMTSPTTETLGLVAAFAALLPGAYLVLRGVDDIWGIKLATGRLDVAELSLLYGFLAGLIDPLRKLSTVYNKLKRSAAAADRIFGLIDSEPLVKQAERPAALPRLAEAVTFRSVAFRYAGAEDAAVPPPPVLDRLDLTVPAGEVIAVVGENGSGKSTLLSLLPRFADPTHGSVLFDGVDIRTTRLKDLRDQLAVVTQQTHLFDASIAENIAYGLPRGFRGDAAAAIESAAARAGVLEFADALPEGLDSRVGAKGGKLSGGQRQRIALARAFVRDPAVLILDEATSAIDAQSEDAIWRSLAAFAPGRTVFVITHAVTPTLLKALTRVAVLENGRVAVSGSPDEVRRASPLFERLCVAADGPDGGGPDGETAAEIDCVFDAGADGFDLTAIDQFDPVEHADEPAPSAEIEDSHPHILKLPPFDRRTGTDG